MMTIHRRIAGTICLAATLSAYASNAFVIRGGKGMATGLDMVSSQATIESFHRSLLEERLRYKGRLAAGDTQPVEEVITAPAAPTEAFQRALLADRLEREAAEKVARTTSAATVAAVMAVEDASRIRSSDLHEALLKRRTINDFESSLPSGWEEALQRAVHAATYAPNHKRTEPWRFHLLGPEAIRRVCELNAEIVTAKKGPAAGEKKLERWLKMPGWLVVTCMREGGGGSSPSMDDPTGIAREDYAACCCAVHNLCLSLHADGIGTKWTTGPVNFDERFADAAGLSPDEYVVGTVWFGVAVSMPNPPIKKLTVGDVLIRHD